MYGDLNTPAFHRGGPVPSALACDNVPTPKRQAKPKAAKAPIVPLSLDIEDTELFRRRWESEIMKDCGTADAIDLKMSAEDRTTLGISV